MDERQQIALVKAIDRTMRKTTDVDVVDLCHIAYKLFPLRLPPTAVTIPLRLLLIAQNHLASTTTSDEANDLRQVCKWIISRQDKTLLPNVPNNTVPENPPSVPKNISGTNVPKKATRPRGRPPSQTPKSEAERKAEYRARKHTELELILKGTKPKDYK